MNEAEQSNNRRIARNAVMLYIRMGLSMIVGLYTSRVVLATLGVSDYGIYGVVGGIVGMMGFLNASMAGATSRFITFELGRGDEERLRKTFSSALIVHFGISLVILLLAETVGLWFLENKLVIPEGRMDAARWVYQLSILSAVISIPQAPYSAVLIAHEKMDIYAYFELLNVGLKLLIVYLLQIGDFDKLILYAVLTFAVSVFMIMLYRVYCIRHYSEARFRWIWDKTYLRPLLSFSGWDLYGNACVAARSQGTNFLINMFFGVIYNAAAGVATTIYGMVTWITFNIEQAYRPQIIKQYAVGNYTLMQKYMHDATKYTMILLGCVAIPCYLELPTVFYLWLGIVPEGAVFFCRALLIGIVATLVNTIVSNGIHATGDVRLISFISGTIQLLSIPVLYLFFRMRYGVEWSYIVFVGTIYVITVANIIICKYQIPEFRYVNYLILFTKSLVITLLTALPCYVLFMVLSQSVLRLVLVSCVSVISSSAVAYAFILDGETRQLINAKLCRLAR